MTDAVGLVPLISFFHPQRLWLLAAVPLLLLLYFGLLQRSRTRARTRGIDNLAKVMPKQAAWKRHVAVVAAVMLTLRRREGAKHQNPSQQVRVNAADRLRMVRMPAELPGDGEGTA